MVDYAEVGGGGGGGCCRCCVPPVFSSTTTVKFNAGQFVSRRTQNEKISKYYSIKSALGSGGYGEVFLAKHKQSGAERAIKVIEKSKWSSDENDAVLNEFNIVKDLDHPVSKLIIPAY